MDTGMTIARHLHAVIMRTASVLRSSRGAFDMMSVIVGAAVVAILVGGTLAATYGVIPWVQDNGARQDLGAVRTAQSVAKVRDGRFMNDAGLRTANYLNADGSLAVGANGDGSCWVGFSRSDAGKTFFTTADKAEPEPYSKSVDTGCVPRADQKSLAIAVGTPMPPVLAAAWGYNYYGQLGNGTTINSTAPTEATRTGALAGKSIEDIDSGSAFSCAIADGSVFCWGNNDAGGLGTGVGPASNVPVAVNTAGHLAGRTFTKITVGASHACGLSAGQIFCWGSDSFGQLGNDTVSGVGNLPIPVVGDLAGKTITDVDAGTSITCATTSEGKVYCWGRGDSWLLGNGNMSDRHLPWPVTDTGVLLGKKVTSVRVGGNGVCVIADGAPACWGQIASSIDYYPAAITGVLSGKTVTSLAAGHFHFCGVADGKPYCWGRGGSGSFGSGIDYVPATKSPVAVDTSGAMAGKTTSTVTAGGDTTCVMADELPFCWGYNQYGQAATGGTTNVLVPAQVSTPSFMTGKTPVRINVGHWSTFALYE